MKNLSNEYIEEFLNNFQGEENEFNREVIRDLWITKISREASILGRKEVLKGNAKFGITGDGNELPQVALAKYIQEGDWRSGYYRDQTLLFALDLMTVEQFFAQLYADTVNDPFSGGRQMNSHFATATIDQDGNWLDHTERINISSDISTTGGQMSRALGIAMASRIYRNQEINTAENFSDEGDEVSFVTIGDASTSEGIFWEALNCAAVNRVPMCTLVWDNGYGISVPRERQTVKDSISEALRGFETENEDDNGIYIEQVKAWDYVALNKVFAEVVDEVREHHKPALIHVQETTQPQGHSTSGSHERYKSKDRLDWEKEYDCILKFEEWILANEILTAEQIETLGNEAIQYTRQCKENAWNDFQTQKDQLKNQLLDILKECPDNPAVSKGIKSLEGIAESRYSALKKARKIYNDSLYKYKVKLDSVKAFIDETNYMFERDYSSYLYSETPKAATNIPVVHAEYSDDAKKINGYQILNKFFDKKLSEIEGMIAFGEDVGQIGDVNQGFAGLQDKYGVYKVFDTGIREYSIMGLAIGTSMRGLRPIAEIQYLDYLLYGICALSDDLATMRYRSKNLNAAPAIIRTRGHRLEGIWHSGSPMAVLINSLRGMHIVVPRNMTQAIGFYNTLLQSDDPAVVVECLNGYRLKELEPSNIGSFSLPLGVPEVLQEGDDITIVSYGSTLRFVEQAVTSLKEIDIHAEVIDVQTLLPFDLEHRIVDSLKKTNKLLIVDEDLPGATAAFILNKVLEEQNGYRYLDSKPKTLTAKAHRPPFGSDGDYWTKPNHEDVYEAVVEMVLEAQPNRL